MQYNTWIHWYNIDTVIQYIDTVIKYTDTVIKYIYNIQIQ